MNFKICFSILICCHLYQVNFAQTFEWVKRVGTRGSDTGMAVLVDDTGNVYSTGFYSGRGDFDLTLPGVELDSFGGWDIFVQKQDAAGNLIWAKGFGSSSFDQGNSIAVDGEGSVFTVGFFRGQMDADPGAGEHILAAVNGSTNEDAFIQKLDADGNFLWAHNIGGIIDDKGFYVDLDAEGNVYMVGQFRLTADFDPGTGIFQLASTSSGSDIFILKLNTDGDFIWAKKIDGQSSERPTGFVVDPAGNLYLNGVFAQTVDFDPGPEIHTTSTPGMSANSFLLNLDLNGNFIWVKTIESLSNVISYSLALDPLGNFYTTGTLSGTTDFDPGPDAFNLNNGNGDDIFIQKLNADGDFVWAVVMEGNKEEFPHSIAADEYGNVYLTGLFGAVNAATGPGALDIDPGPGIYPLETVNGTDIFILKLNASSNLEWGYRIGETITEFTSIERGFSIVVDEDQNLYVTGVCNGGDFDPGPAVLTPPQVTPGSISRNDAFILKWSQCVLTTGNLTVTACNSYSLNDETYTESGTYTQTLENSMGCDSIITLNLTINAIDTSMTLEAATLTANAIGATYQWVDCSNNFTPIPEATDQSFTALTSGTYAVIITHSGCVDTSSCYAVTVVGVDDTPIEERWQVYPNPTSGKINIEVPEGLGEEIAIEIRNSIGQLLQKKIVSHLQVMELDLKIPAGVYMVRIQSGNREKTINLVKK